MCQRLYFLEGCHASAVCVLAVNMTGLQVRAEKAGLSPVLAAHSLQVSGQPLFRSPAVLNHTPHVSSPRGISSQRP